MGKRGPPPRGEYPDQRAVLSTRIRPSTRAHLEAAAASSGRSLSQEIEFRLIRSFRDDEDVQGRFGSRANYALARLVAVAMESSFNADAPGADWRVDPQAFDQSMRCVVAVLNAYKPSSPIPPASTPAVDIVNQMLPKSVAARLVRDVQNADPALPLNEGSRRDHFLSQTHADLGELTMRPEVFEGSAEQMRIEAQALSTAAAKKVGKHWRGK